MYHDCGIKEFDTLKNPAKPIIELGRNEKEQGYVIEYSPMLSAKKPRKLF